MGQTAQQFVAAIVMDNCFADHRPQAGQPVTLTSRLDTQDAEAVLGIMECNPVDQPSERLGRSG